MPAIRSISGSAPYFPTAPRSGSVGEAVFRFQNLFKRSTGGTGYWEVSAGPLDLSETIATSALTGTLATTANSTTITGTGTAFTTELHPGQFFLIVDAAGNRSFLCCVERVASTTSVIVSQAPSASVSGKTGYRLPVIFALDTQRGTAIRGNVVRNDRGTLFSVGDGTFRLNGSALGGSSLTLTRDPKVSIYDNATGNYANYTLGLPTPTGQTVANVAGGTRGMQAASYSILITAERAEYTGHGNPGARLDFTIAAGERPEITFGSMDATSGQSAWGLWGTRYLDSLGADKNYLNGPWFRINAGSGDDGQVLAADLTAGKLALEWLDAEIESNRLITFDNDAPPDAEFVALFNGVPVWVSTNGPGNTSPGPYISPAKPSNIEAAPAGLAYPTSPPEVILGCVSALGRLYLLTTNHLQIAQGTPDDRVPVIIRPFWRSGFKNPFQVIFVSSGMLYGNSTSGPVRSFADGDEQKTATDWAAPLTEFTKDWVTGHVLIAEDPLNNAVIYFHSAYSLNSSGFWTTRWWAYGLEEQEWVADGLLSSTTRDQIVSGVATVGDYLEFLMGGRKSDNSVEIKSYRFEAGSGSSVDYYLASNFSDSGEELRPKRLGPSFKVAGKITSGSLKVYGASSTQAIPVSDLEAGTNALATLTLSNGTNVTEGAALKANIKNLRQHAVRVSGTWSGSGTRDRLEEVVYELSVEGARK